MKDRAGVSTAGNEAPERDALAQIIRAAGPRPSPRREDFERVWQASRRAWQAKVRAGRRRRVIGYALAAGVALTAVGLLLGPQLVPPAAVARVAVLHGQVERFATDARRWQALEVGAAIPAGTKLRTAASGKAAFVLANGASLRIDEATTWTFEGATRLMLEGGTLYVDTGRQGGGHAGRVEIATVHGVVHDIGTQFEVRALSAQLRLRVREGRVQLVTATARAPYEAPAGEELSLAADGAIGRVPLAPDAVEWRWAEALAAPIELDGGSAFEVLQWVARETGKRLVFADANTELRARSAIIHGSSAGLEPLQILEVVMATSAGLDYTLGEGTLLIRRR